MGNRVNPPKQLFIPKEFRKDPETSNFIDNLLFIINQLFDRSGAGEDYIDDLRNESNSSEASSKARLFDLQKQIGSGKPLTIDTTGFTIDNTEQTTDMTEVR